MWSALLQVFAFNKYYSYILFTIVQVQLWTATCINAHQAAVCYIYYYLTKDIPHIINDELSVVMMQSGEKGNHSCVFSES